MSHPSMSCLQVSNLHTSTLQGRWTAHQLDLQGLCRHSRQNPTLRRPLLAAMPGCGGVHKLPRASQAARDGGLIASWVPARRHQNLREGPMLGLNTTEVKTSSRRITITTQNGVTRVARLLHTRSSNVTFAASWYVAIVPDSTWAAYANVLLEPGLTTTSNMAGLPQDPGQAQYHQP